MPYYLLQKLGMRPVEAGRFLRAILLSRDPVHMQAQPSAVPPNQAHRPRRSHLFSSAPRWMLLIPLTIVGLLAGLVGMTFSFDQQVGTLHDDHGLPEQILGVLASTSARVIVLTGRPGANVRLIYDPVRQRGGLVIVRLSDPGDDLTYHLWLVQRGVPHLAATFVPAGDRATFVPFHGDLTRYDSVTIDVGVHNRRSGTVTPILHASLASSSQRQRTAPPVHSLKME